MNLGTEQYKNTFPERIQAIERFLETENTMNTEVETVKPVSKALAPQVAETSWGSEGTSMSDMIIPRILLMQALSDFVSKGEVVAGDIVESLNGTVLAKKGQPIEIIPFMSIKEWMTFKMINGKWEYTGRVPYGPANAAWEYETKINGVQHRNDAVLSFFCVIPSRIGELPHLCSFRRSSYQAGKKLSTHFQVSAMKKVPPAGTVFKLNSQQQTIDKNTFWTLNVVPSRPSTKEELGAAYDWYTALKHKPAKVEDEEVPF